VLKTSLTGRGANTSSLHGRCWCQYPITMLVLSFQQGQYCHNCRRCQYPHHCHRENTSITAAAAVSHHHRRLVPVRPSKLPPSPYTSSVVLACTFTIVCACTFSTVVGEKNTRQNLQTKPPAPSLVPKSPSLPTVLFFLNTTSSMIPVVSCTQFCEKVEEIYFLVKRAWGSLVQKGDRIFYQESLRYPFF